MSAHHHSAYLVPGSPAPQAARRVDSHHEPHHTAPQPAHSSPHSTIIHSEAVTRSKLPLSRRQLLVPTQTEPVVLPAPQVSLQGSTPQTETNYSTSKNDPLVPKAAYHNADHYAVPNNPPQQRIASARTSPEVGRYHRSQYMLNGQLYSGSPPTPVSAYEQARYHISASEDEQSTQYPAPPTSESDSSRGRRSSETLSLEAQVDQVPGHSAEHGFKFTIASIPLDEYEQSQDVVSNATFNLNDCPPLTPGQIRWINKYGNTPHTYEIFDLTRYVDHFDFIPVAHCLRRGSVSSMNPMDSDLLDGNVKPSLLKYVESRYTKAGHFVQGVRKTLHSMWSE